MEFFTALLLIILPVAFNLVFFRLGQVFDYPAILRRPPAEVLERFQAGGTSLRRLWYFFALTAAVFIFLPVLVQFLFGAVAPWYLVIGTVAGVLAGAAQLIGLIRWAFLVPSLAERHQRAAAASLEREAIEIVFDAFHRFIGTAIGEHLGYAFTATWSLIVSLAILETGLFPDWLGWAGLVPAIGIAIGLTEEAGFKPAGPINALAYVLWSVWLVSFGVILLV